MILWGRMPRTVVCSSISRNKTKPFMRSIAWTFLWNWCILVGKNLDFVTETVATFRSYLWAKILRITRIIWTDDTCNTKIKFNSLAYKTRFHLIFRLPAWSKRNIILTVTAQSNRFLHLKAINKYFQGETFRIGTPDISTEKYPKIE